MSRHGDEIDFGDARGLADLYTFIKRARVGQPGGAIRLQVAAPGVLVLTVAVLEGTGLLGEGTVLGLRAVPVQSATSAVDVTVAYASVTDRLARLGPTATVIGVPEVTLSPAWAGLTPPREGWESVGTLSAADVEGIAQQGIAQIAEGTPDGAGSRAVETLRRRVWGAMSDTVPPIAAGLAFGAHVLGFLREEERPVVATCGRWTRLSTSRGHVLVR